MKKTLIALAVASFLGLSETSCSALSHTAPPLSLAKNYTPEQEFKGYWVSEKMDGVRAYWDGRQLLSRSGVVFHAPEWFTRDFPQRPLDGELWMGRGSFNALMHIVRDKIPDEEAWRQVRYWVFDLPSAEGGFRQRNSQMLSLASHGGNPAIRWAQQVYYSDSVRLQQHMLELVLEGGEGLMLQQDGSPYTAGRHTGLLKMKPFADAEATVLAYTPGKGKYQGQVGALLVQGAGGLQFKLGSGLSDAQRLHPPAIGSRVTYRYQGRTATGLPRFARFLRLRPLE